MVVEVVAWEAGRTPVGLTRTRIPSSSLGPHFLEPEEALPGDNPLLQVGAAAFPVSGDVQVIPRHLRGKEHITQLPKLPGRWTGLSGV